MIETLKAQIGELMKGQSAERQQQIAELRKKLVNAAQEANELRFLPKKQSFINALTRILNECKLLRLPHYRIRQMTAQSTRVDE